MQKLFLKSCFAAAAGFLVSDAHASALHPLGADDSRLLYHYFEHLGVTPIQETRAERSLEVSELACRRHAHSGYELESELSFFECSLDWKSQLGVETGIESYHPHSSHVFWTLDRFYRVKGSGKHLSSSSFSKPQLGVHKVAKVLCFETTDPHFTYSCFLTL